MIVTGVIVALMIAVGVIEIRMRVGRIGHSLCAGQHEFFLRRCCAWRNLVAKCADSLLDPVLRGLPFIQRQSQALRHDPDLDAAYSRQTRDRILDFGRAGPAVHASHCPVAGRFACSFRHRHSSCRRAGS